MLVISRQDRERLGLAQVLEACRCYSPQGRRLKAAGHYFGPRDRPELEAELSAIEALKDQLGHHQAQVLEVQSLLGHLRDLRGTMESLRKGRTLALTELFEIKEAARLIHKLAGFKTLIKRAGVHLLPMPQVQSLLDPTGQGRSGFSLYDDYSARLAGLRRERAQLEREMEDQGHNKEVLEARRRELIAGEREEEALVRQDLSQKLSPHAKALADNLEAAGRLDFRLAKADLALAWGASRPTILDEGQTIILEAFFHPQIQAHIRARGGAYERQTITLEAGTTVLSGPNMGGKSVSLKAMTLALLLIHMGYFPPAAFAASPLFDFVSYSSDHFDTTRKGLSSFASEMVRLRDDLARSKEQRGLIVIDEPCRGTNPREASALIGALVRTYAKKQGAFILATHYPTPSGPGIRHIRIKGLMEEALQAGMASDKKDLSDEEAIRRIESLMDYSLEAVEGGKSTQEGAVRIAAWLGMDQELLALLEEENLWPT
ncbi:MAG: hypothetical protein GX849_01405 [Clostridiaceae bacterium]|nr:hypothetical protein [Clostridiaceae bacterium]